MALKPIDRLSFFEQVHKNDDFLDKLDNVEQAIWKVTGHPGPPGGGVAIGSGSYHPSTCAGRRIAWVAQGKLPQTTTTTSTPPDGARSGTRACTNLTWGNIRT